MCPRKRAHHELNSLNALHKQFFERAFLVAENCMAIPRKACDPGLVPPRRFFRLRLVPECVHKRIVFGELSNGSGRRKMKKEDCRWSTLGYFDNGVGGHQKH